MVTPSIRARIISALREISVASDAFADALNATKVAELNPHTNRMRTLYRCAHCAHLFPLSEIERDHIIPIGQFNNDWNSYIDKIFDGKNIQILCQICHKKKTLNL